MRKTVVMLVLASLCSGCATAKIGEGSLMQRYAGSKQLAQAEEMLAKGDTAGATKTLNAVSNGPSVPGVTDEALFRLALLAMKPGAERPASAQGHQLLRRLNKEFPKSPWTQLAAPLNEMIGAAEDLRKQNKNLRSANQSLNKEIAELNHSLEQLKHLDLELEKKSR